MQCKHVWAEQAGRIHFTFIKGRHTTLCDTYELNTHAGIKTRDKNTMLIILVGKKKKINKKNEIAGTLINLSGQH